MLRLNYSKKSWHYRMLYFSSPHFRGKLNRKSDINFCWYWREVVVYTMGLGLGIATVGYSMYTLVEVLAFNLSELIVEHPVQLLAAFVIVLLSVGASVLVAWGIMKLLCWFEKRKNEPSKPWFITEAYRSFREKICKIVYFSE